MRHPLSFVILLIVGLVAGLPRLNHIDGASGLVVRKSNLETHILTGHLENLDEDLVRRTNAKGVGIKGGQATSTTKVLSPTPLPAPKHEPKSATTATKDQAGTALSSKQKSGNSVLQKEIPIPKPRIKQDLAGSQASPGTKTKAGPQSASKQKSGASLQAIGIQRNKPGSKPGPANSEALSEKERSRAGSTQQTAERGLKSGQQQGTKSTKQRALGNSVASSSEKANRKQRTGLNGKQGTQSSPTGFQNKRGKHGLQKDTTSGDVGGSKNRSIVKKGAAGSTRSKGLPSETKGPGNLKTTPQGSKQSGKSLSKASSKGSPQRKRLCRRANGRESCSLDIEEGGGGLPQSSISQPSTSQSNSQSASRPDPQRAPSMISQMSRASRAAAKENPLVSAGFVLGGAAAAMGNGAGLTNDCCNEDCANTASHVLKYCGLTAGVAAAGVGFAGMVIDHQKSKNEKQEDKKEVEKIKTKTEGHAAAIEEHGRKIRQTNEKFTGELRMTKQTLNQVSKRVGGPRLIEDVT